MKLVNGGGLRGQSQLRHEVGALSPSLSFLVGKMELTIFASRSCCKMQTSIKRGVPVPSTY